MELKKIQPGYPCHKYLARNIRSEDDLWLYAKAFITTLISQGTEWNTAIDLLIASLVEMPSSTGLSCPDFLNLRHSAKESCLFIMNNDAVPVFRSCNSYYRKKDSKTPCCRLCPLSNIYYNVNEQREYEVLKFIFTNKDNFDFAMQYFDADFFKCAMDVSMEIYMDKACVVPVLKELVISALKSNLRLLLFDNAERSYFSGDSSAFAIAWEDAISRFPREKRIPAKLKNNPMWANVLKQYIYDNMMAASDITQDDVREIFDVYLNLSIQQVSENKKKEPVWIDMQIEDIITQEESVSSSQGSVLKEIDENVPSDIKATDKIDNADSAVKEDIVSCENDASGSVEDTEDLTINPVHGTGGIELVDDSFENVTKEETIQELLNDNNEADAVNETVIENNENALKSPEQELLQSDELQDSLQHESISDIEASLSLSMNRNMIVHVILDDSAAKQYCEILSTPNIPDAAYQGILRDKSISLEIVLTESGTYAYLIWSRHTKKYYYIIASNSSGNLYEVLSRNMIRKICHTPYLLYGVSRLYGHIVKNVMAIQTAHCRLTGNTAVMSYESIMALYDMQKEFGRGISDEMKSACIFFAGLPFYKGIAKVISDGLDYYEKPLLYIMDCNVDESIGYSYLYARNFDDAGFLVQLLPDGRHLFREEFLHISRQSGYFISYTVSNNVGAIHIFRYLLHCLSRDGHMRKCNLQLIGLQKSYVTFYVSDDYFDYITTVINMYLFEYSSLYPSQAIKINQLTDKCFIKKHDLQDN